MCNFVITVERNAPETPRQSSRRYFCKDGDILQTNYLYRIYLKYSVQVGGPPACFFGDMIRPAL